MKLDWNSAKREECLARNAVDFAWAGEIFEGLTFDFTDNRRLYREARIITIGFLNGRMMVVVWTPQDETRRIISMRKANAKEQNRYAHHFS